MDKDFKEIVKEKLKEIRNDNKMTQKEFSDFVGISQQTLSGYENGKMFPSLEVVKDISQKCNVSCDWLLGISNQKNIKRGFETYSDIITVLISLIYTVYCEFRIVSESDPYFDFDIDLETLVIKDDNIQKFMKEWKAIYKLKEDGTINDDLYSLWIKDKISNYDYKIKNEEDTEDIDDSDLPF